MRRSKILKSKPAPSLHWEFKALGTQWAVDAVLPQEADSTAATGHAERPAQIQTAIRQRLEVFEAAYSRFRSDSIVASIARAAGRFKLPADAGALLGLYARMFVATDGAVTPVIGQVLADAGYDAEYSLRPKPVIHQPSPWPEVARFESPFLYTTQPLRLDFGAAGKGYAVDLVAELLEAHGVSDYCVDAGGDMRHRSAGTPLQVGLEHPDHPGQVIGVATLGDASLCGSAGNRRAWGDFTHIINPHTGRSPRHIKAVWVMTGNTLLADGMTTCLFFVDPKILQQSFIFEYAIVYADNSAEWSAGFVGELF